LVPEAVTARVMVGLLTCLFYCLVVNLVRPYTASSDFTLQNLCHTQLFITMFAALLIKAEVPILGFSPHLRPIEANFCGWVVVVSHAFVSLWGFTNIVHERFFSSEARRVAASKKKAKHDLKQRMAKFKRAKKKLMTKVRAGSMFGGGGILGGLSELGAMMGSGAGAKKKKNAFKKIEDNTTAEQSVAGSTSNMLLGALMSSDNVENHGSLLGGNDGGDVGRNGDKENDGGLDFAWPGKEQDHSDGEDAVSSDSAVSTPPSSDSEEEEVVEDAGAVGEIEVAEKKVEEQDEEIAGDGNGAGGGIEGGITNATKDDNDAPGTAGLWGTAGTGELKTKESKHEEKATEKTKDAAAQKTSEAEKTNGDDKDDEDSSEESSGDDDEALASLLKVEHETKTTGPQTEGGNIEVKKILEVADLSSGSSDDDSSSDSDDGDNNNF